MKLLVLILSLLWSIVRSEFFFNYKGLKVSIKEPFVKHMDLPDLRNDFETFIVRVNASFSDSKINFVISEKDYAIPFQDSLEVTLCPLRGPRSLTLVANTLSNDTLIFDLEVISFDMELKLGDKYATNVSVGKPLTVRVNSEASYRDHFYINAESSDKEICMIVAVTSSSCPIKNTPETVQRSDVWQTALGSSAITVRARTHSFMDPFYVSVVVMPDSFVCRYRENQDTYGDLFISHVESRRWKNVTISVTKGEAYNSYILPVFSMIGGLLGFIIFSSIIVCSKSYEAYDEADYVNKPEDSAEGERLRLNDESFDAIGEDQKGYTLYNDCKSVVSEDSTRANRYRRIQLGVMRFRDRPRVADLTAISAGDTWFRRNRSRVYLYLLPLVSLFYFVPAIQFVFLAKNQQEKTGSQDLCFHNFKCSKPYSIFTDFNHAISNISYVFYGIAFNIIVLVKKHKLPPQHQPKVNHNTHVGVPQQFSVFFSMGFALIAQGAFSVCYHVCPTNISLQFDTTMMYFICILCIVKLYQFRHPDATFNAYSTFGLLGIVVLLEALVLYTSSWLAYGLFIVLYIGTTIGIGFDYYFMGVGRLDRALARELMNHIVKNVISCQIFKGLLYPLRFFIALLFVFLNLTYSIYLIVSKLKHPRNNLTHAVLVVLAGNLGMYLLYYIIRKVVQQKWGQSGRYNPIHKFKCCGRTYKCRFPTGLFFGTICVVSGFVGIYFYSSRSANRNLSPAESRNLNSDCEYMNFFDNHDLWHMFGATAVFSAFISLLTTDDDVLYTDRKEIDVF